MVHYFGPVEKSYMRHPKDAGNRKRRAPKKYQNRPPTKYGFVTFLNKPSRDSAIQARFVVDFKGRKWQIKAFRSKNESRNQKMKNMEMNQLKSEELQEFELFKQFK